MAWSSFDTVYIAADHNVPNRILSALSRSERVAEAEFCLCILHLRTYAPQISPKISENISDILDI
jgi:hypothetical protein